MALTLLQVVQEASKQLGITNPSSVTGSSDIAVLQLLALYNQLGRDLIRDYEWRRATFIETFATSDTVSKTGNTTVDSAVVSGMSNTTGLSAGMQVSGTGIPSFALIESVDSGTQITMDMVATATGTGTTLTFATQDFDLPTGFDRMVSGTNWNRTNHWMNLGPKSAQEWQWLNGGAISTAPRFRYRIVGNKLRLFPAPTDVLNMAYEYVSSYWVIATGGSTPTKASTTADTDLAMFPDDVMLWGLKYYWQLENKLEFGTAEMKFLDALSKAKSQDEDNPTLSLNPNRGTFLLGAESIPESFPNIT